jgi:hypothetical protein
VNDRWAAPLGGDVDAGGYLSDPTKVAAALGNACRAVIGLSAQPARRNRAANAS